MKIKRVNIGIKNSRDVLDDFVKTGELLEKGEHVKKEMGVYFESINGFRKALTPKRLELLHLIKEKQPKSLQELAMLTDRDIKNIIIDIQILEHLGLIDMKRKKEGRKKSEPRVQYDAIDVLVAI